MSRPELELTDNARRVLEKRYLQKNDRGEVVETPAELFERVARAVAEAEAPTLSRSELEALTADFHDLLVSLRFLPNSPTLMNAGTEMGQLAACFVLPVEDSVRAIFQAVGQMAEIHKSGGGTGFSFSRIRPRGDVVQSTGGIASGPVSFIEIFDKATDVIKQGGRRRGANMGILRVDHPDVREFVEAKRDLSRFRNFNLSVGVTDRFMTAVREGGTFSLVNPRTGATTEEVEAGALFDEIAEAAWRCGDPGLVFLDEINRRHPLPETIEATNPCGEVPLLPYEACNLGSIDLARMVVDGRIDWERLGATVQLAVRFLDDVITVSRYPLAEIDAAVRRNRKLGLGVMGFAGMLIRLGISYLEERALELADRVFAFIQERAVEASTELARKRGVFESHPESRWAREERPMRNATVTAIAPTGTISILAGTTFGIEPLYAIAFRRNVLEGEVLTEWSPFFLEKLEEMELDAERLRKEVGRRGTLKDVADVPEELRRLFPTAQEIPAEWHIRMQAAFQPHVDNAVSKTINLAEEATAEDIREAYLLAHELGCKGITVFRQGSRDEQVMESGEGESNAEPADEVCHVC